MTAKAKKSQKETRKKFILEKLKEYNKKYGQALKRLAK